MNNDNNNNKIIVICTRVLWAVTLTDTSWVKMTGREGGREGWTRGREEGRKEGDDSERERSREIVYLCVRARVSSVCACT